MNDRQNADRPAITSRLPVVATAFSAAGVESVFFEGSSVGNARRALADILPGERGRIFERTPRGGWRGVE